MAGIGGVKDYAGLEAVILQLVKAIVERRRCLVEYRAPGRDTLSRFPDDSYRLLSVHGGLYCIGQVSAYGGHDHACGRSDSGD